MRSIVCTLVCFWAISAAPIIAADQSKTTDTCRAQMPTSLVAAVAEKFPGYRAPLEADNEPDDIAYSRKHRGNGCLAVARGDFFGNGNGNFLMGLTALKGPSGLVVVARPNKSGWSFQQLGPSWEDFRSRLFVDVERPGKYQRTLALYGPLENGEAQSLRCAHEGASFGETESSEIVYCFNGRNWRYVQVSD